MSCAEDEYADVVAGDLGVYYGEMGKRITPFFTLAR